MGALAGSLTFTRFFVRGEPPKRFRDKFVENIQLRAFEPLAPESEEQEHVGWCAVGRVLDLELDHEKVFYNSYLDLGLRMDRWRVPGALLRAHLAEAEREALEKSGHEKLGKREKAELKARIITRLRRKLMPSMKIVDMSWNLDSGVVRFFNQSPRVHEQFMALFEKTFSLELVADSPYISAERLGLGDAELEALSSVEASTLGGRRRG